MLFVPLPFVVALLLVILLVRMLRDGDSRPQDRLFVALVSIYAVQSVLIGFRWGYGMREVLPAQSLLAAVIAALAYCAFSRLAEAQTSRAGHAPIGWHAAPAALVAFLLLVQRDAVGLALILIFIGYGAALLRLSARGPDALVAARLDGALRSYRALQVTALALVASAVTDMLISLDYAWADGAHSGAVVSLANVIALLLLGGAASAVSPSGAGDEDGSEPEPSLPPAASGEDLAVAERLDALMLSKGLYRDVELNLDRIARRLGLPARRVSAAVNRVHETSVSHYVNRLRIEEACRLLSASDDPVTKIMFDAGFLSKSNFNREFQRLKGMSPKTWRQNTRRANGGSSAPTTA